jgi:hypothetical protein
LADVFLKYENVVQGKICQKRRRISIIKTYINIETDKIMMGRKRESIT